MRKRFILYKITHVPSGSDSINYLKEIKQGKPFFTSFKSEAGRFTLLKAICCSIHFHLSMVPERLA